MYDFADVCSVCKSFKVLCVREEQNKGTVLKLVYNAIKK